MVLRPDPLLDQPLPRARTPIPQPILHVVNRQNRQREPIRLVPNRQLQRRVDVALLLVPSHMHEVLAGPVVRQAVDEPGVGVEGEDDGLVGGEERGVLAVREAVRVVAVRDELEQVDDVDEAHLDVDVGEVLAQQRRRCQRFLRHDVARARDHDVRLRAGVVRRPVPDADAFGAVRDGGLHGEELQVVLLVGDDDVDVVGRAEAVVHCAEEAVGVGREVDADDLWGFVDDDGEEAWVLVREAVVVWWVCQ